jgi:hypothetical protein
MPFLQGSGSISIANLNGFFPGSGTAMSNFYRGGGRVPTTKTVTVVTREPASGELNLWNTFWWVSGPPSFQNPWRFEWYGSAIVWWQYYNATSFTTGNVTYHRGASYYVDGKSGQTLWAIFRTITSSSTASINTGIPSGGQISLSQFFGAETP